MLTGRLTGVKEPKAHSLPDVHPLLSHPPMEGQSGNADAKVTRQKVHAALCGWWQPKTHNTEGGGPALLASGAANSAPKHWGGSRSSHLDHRAGTVLLILAAFSTTLAWKLQASTRTCGWAGVWAHFGPCFSCLLPSALFSSGPPHCCWFPVFFCSPSGAWTVVPNLVKSQTAQLSGFAKKQIRASVIRNTFPVLKDCIFFQRSFRFIAKLSGRYRDVPLTSHPHTCIAFLIINIPQ